MAVPKFFEFFASFLRALKDGEVHSAKYVREFVMSDMKLSDEDLAELLPSGKQSTFSNRVHWARTYLDKAGLVETPSRGHYRITQEGLKAINSGKTIDVNFLEQYESFGKYHSQSQREEREVVPDSNPVVGDKEDITPAEVLDSAYRQINDSLASELMDEVMKLSPTDFEKLVVKLLLKMGYGDGIDNAGIVTPASGDGGIDGIIKEDQLGFSNICIQAKKWDIDATVSRPDLQKFVGALQGEKATKGLFITTASFTKGAKDYVSNLSGLTVVLIDGTQLMKLMIKHNLGVSVEHVYEVKRIDSDFFNDGL